MFPIRDHNPSSRTPFVTWALIATNVIVFLLYYPTLAASEVRLFAFYSEWALVPAEIRAGLDWHTWLTSMFLHGGWMHLIGNMLFLYIFGDNLEDLLGHIGFLLFYITCGLAAAAGQILAAPMSMVPMVGASGAIAGVMGAYLLFFPRARIDVLLFFIIIFKIVTVPAWLMLGLWMGIQVFNGVLTDAAGGGVAYWAHAAGFAAGLLFVLPVWLKRGGPRVWRDWDGHPPHPEAFYVTEQRRHSPIPRVRRVSAPGQGPRDVTRVPRSGRRGPTPWSGGGPRR